MRTVLLVTAVAFVASVAFAACGDPRVSAVADDAATPAVTAPDAGRPFDVAPPSFDPLPRTDAGPPPPPASARIVVYAHSGSDLFAVDPETMEVTRAGMLFEKRGASLRYLNDVTDIALDRRGRMLGVTYDRLLEIDPTGECRAIAPLPAGVKFNGLSFIQTEQGEEVLMASGADSVYRLDPVSGAATRLGTLGEGLMSSGDIVSVAGYGTLITLTGSGGDRLARLDPATGAATVIGPTGFVAVWGLGFWKNRVFGFTQSGEFILIEPRTGAATLVNRISAFPYYGAGVTTAVPVVIE